MAIEASYDSDCPSCGERIESGELIVKDGPDGLWVHQGCGPPTAVVSTRQTTPKPANGAICPSCRMPEDFPVHGNCRPSPQEVQAAFAEVRGEPVEVDWFGPLPGPPATSVAMEPPPPLPLVPQAAGDEVIAAWVPEGSVQMVSIASRPEPPRDGRQRYLLPDVSGKVKSWTRATTVCKSIDRQDALQAWKEVQAVFGVTGRESLYAVAASHRDPHGNDRKLWYGKEGIVAQAHIHAGTHDKADQGKALHRFCELLDTGAITLDQIPKRWRPQCENYMQTMADNGIRMVPELIEKVYIDDRYGVAGTGDRGAHLVDRRLPVILDLKTGSTMKYSVKANATQLAIYQGHTATYDVHRNKRGDRVEMDPEVGIIVHLPQDGDTCTVYQYDLGRGREHYMTALEVRAIQASKDDEIACLYRPANVLQPYDWIASRLWGVISSSMGDPAQVGEWVRTNWPTEVRCPFPPDPTRAEVDAMDAFLAPLERELGAPFTVGVAA